MRGKPAAIEFVPGATLLPCPVCGWVGDGMTEAEFWRHVANSHADEVEQARRDLEVIRSFAPDYVPGEVEVEGVVYERRFPRKP